MRYLADDEFLRGKVPMTKREVRILTMAELAAMPGDIVADIGAGTGSLSIEAARAVGDGTVYAVERNPEAVQLIRENARRFGLTNIVVEEQEAPAGLEQLPLLDGAIVGGSGGQLEAILAGLDARLRPGGRIVLNCITMQTLAAALGYLRQRADYHYTAMQVQINRLQPVGAYDMAKGMNPIFIVTATKQEDKA